MNTNYIIGLLSVIISLTSCESSHKKGHYESIFNGNNLEGWYLKVKNGDDALAKKVFAVEDRTIHIFNHQFSDSLDLDNKKYDTYGMMFTDKTYSKFILKFEYKWGSKIANNFSQFQYDAGCYYHVIDDKVWPKGLEYQIRYNHLKEANHTGDFWATQPLAWYTSKDSSRFLSPKDGGVRIPKINEALACKTNAFNALNDQWNQCEIVVMEDKYAVHKLNGKIVNIATHLQIKEGKIGFQSETAEIYYRDIKIKTFDHIIPLKKILDE